MKKLILIFILCARIVSAQTPWTDATWQIYKQDSFITLGQYNNGDFSNLFYPITTPHGLYDPDYTKNQLEPALPSSSSSNVYISGGQLHLAITNQTGYYGSYTFPYSTGALQSLENFKYGYFETKCILPHGNGLWDAFWLQSGVMDVPYCSYSELDIFENQGHLYRFTSSSSIHQSSLNPCTTTSTPYGPVSNNPVIYDGAGTYSLPYDLTGYHIWGCEWSPNVIVFYLDNVETARKVITSDMTIQNVMGLLIGLTLNSEYNNASFGFPLVDNTTPMPSEMIVDYVRIYKLNQSGCQTNNVNLYTLTDFASYTHTVKHNITVGSGTSFCNLPTGTPINLRASNSITINPGVYIPLGTEFTAQITGCY